MILFPEVYLERDVSELQIDPPPEVDQRMGIEDLLDTLEALGR